MMFKNGGEAQENIEQSAFMAMWAIEKIFFYCGVRNEQLASVWEALDVFRDICNAYNKSHHIPSDDELKELLFKTNMYTFLEQNTCKAPLLKLYETQERDNLRELLRRLTWCIHVVQDLECKSWRMVCCSCKMWRAT